MDSQSFSFPTTQWDVVSQGKAAVAEIYHRYRPALKAFLIRGRRVNPNDADDLIQGFAQSRLLEQDLIGTADRNRGKFRSYLMAAFRYYLSNVHKYERAGKRSPNQAVVSLEGGEWVPQPAAVDAFEVAWAREVLHHTLRTMRDHCQQEGRSDVWKVFEARLLVPILGHGVCESYEQLCRQLQVRDVTVVANLLVTAKRLFERMLEKVLGEYCRSEADVQEEMVDLLEILSRARAESSGIW